MARLENYHTYVYGFGLSLFYLGFEFLDTPYNYIFGSLGGLMVIAAPVLILFGQTKRRAVFQNYTIAYGMGVVAFVLFFLKSGAFLGAKDLAGNDTVQTLLSLTKLVSVLLILASVVYLTFTELSYRSLDFSSEVDRQRLNFSRQSALMIIIMVPIIIGINYIAREKNFNFDLTHDSSYSLQSNSLKILKNIDRKIEVFAFFPVGGLTVTSGRKESQIRNTNAISKEVEIMLENMRDVNSNIDLTFLDSRTEEEVAGSMNVTSNGVVVFRVANESDSLSEDSFIIERVYIKSVDALKQMEQKFMRALIKVSSPKRQICMTTDNGEVNLAASQSSGLFASQQFKNIESSLRNSNFKLKTWALDNGYPTSVPAKCDAVWILAPKNEPSPELAQTLHDYIGKGGKLVLVLDPTQNVLMKEFLSGLQLIYKNEKIRSETQFPHIIGNVQFDKSHIIYDSLKDEDQKVVFLSEPGYFQRDGKLKKKIKGLRRVELLNTGNKNYIDANNNGQPDQNEAARKKNLVVLFEGGAPKSKKKKGAPTGSEVKGKIALFGGYNLFRDSLTQARTNRLFLAATFRWLTENEALIGITPKAGTITPVSLTTKEKNIMYYMGLVILPLLLFGGGFAYTRYAARKFE